MIFTVRQTNNFSAGFGRFHLEAVSGDKFSSAGKDKCGNDWMNPFDDATRTDKEVIKFQHL